MRDNGDAETSVVFSPDQLPQDLVVTLHEAAIRADIERLEVLIRQAEPYDQHLAAQLRHLAARFGYDRILELLEGTSADEWRK